MKYVVLLLECLCWGMLLNAQVYKVGDVITNKDGSQGVVFWINADGSEGWMVALHDLPQPVKWGTSNIDVPGLENIGSGLEEYSRIFPALADTSGYQNTLKLRKTQEEGSQYPGQLVDFKSGWYVPAAGQMRRLFTAMNTIRPMILGRGGDDLKRAKYWSSTEYNVQSAWYVYCNPGEVNSDTKDSAFYVRPVRSFSVRWVEYDRSLAYQWNSGQSDPGITVYPQGNATYEVEVTTAAGCSNKASRQVMVASGKDTTIVAYVCPGESYTQNGFQVTKADTTYELKLQNAKGCEKTVTLHLFRKDTTVTVFDEAICEGGRYDLHNFTAWEAGCYQQTWTGANGCDSTVILNLTVHALKKDTIEAVICEGESYTQNDFRASVPGFYDQHLQSSCGCDSLVTLHLTTNPVYRDTLRASICEGEIYTEYGFHGETSGYYNLLLQSVQGCDSLITVDLSVNPVYRDTIFAAICMGETYTENGFDASRPGFYNQSFRSVSGCDSLVTLHLAVNPVYLDTVEIAICEGERYTGHGLDATLPGDYNVSFKTISGCDSLFFVRLTINPAYEILLYDTICEGEPYNRYGFSETLTGMYEQHLQSKEGCDSAIYLHLTVNNVYDTLLLDTVCVGQKYKKYGFEIGAVHPGQSCEPLYLQSRHNCDSVVRLQLIVSPVYLFSDSHMICQGGQWNFRDKLVQEAGIYRDTLKTLRGCDSIYELDLSVNGIYRDTVEASICEGEYYREYGFNVNEAGFYEQHLQTVKGCDSIIYLFLKVEKYFDGEILAVVENCAEHIYRFEVDWKNEEALKGEYRFRWNFGDKQSSEEEIVKHQYKDIGTYPVRLQVVSAANCSKQREILHNVPYYSSEVNIYSKPESIDSEHPWIHLWTDSLPFMSYEWDLGDGHQAIGSSIFHVYSFDRSETYQVRLTCWNPDNCPAEQTLLINAYKVVDPPNTFSPNGDGINDYFMQGYRLGIVDRNGVEIFKGNDGWDGKRNGQQVPEDTYFYELFYLTSQGEKLKTGYITVVR